MNWLIEKDKLIHLGVGYLIAHVVFALISLVTSLPLLYCLLIGVSVSLLATFAKDFIYDKLMGKGVFNWKDILAGCIGASVFALIELVVCLAVI